MFDNIQYAQSFNGNVCEIGSYIGNGTHGEDNPTTITFGSYPALVVVASVNGGQAGGVTGTYNGGAGAGNKGTDGTTSGATNPSNGMFSNYGYGTNVQGAYATLSGGPGAVYLKYLGE